MSKVVKSISRASRSAFVARGIFPVPFQTRIATQNCPGPCFGLTRYPRKWKRAVFFSCTSSRSSSSDSFAKGDNENRIVQGLPKSVDVEAVLKAFDNALESDSFETDNDTSSAKIKQKGKLKEDESDIEHLRRLEILTALPTDLSVSPRLDQCPGCGCMLQSKDEDLPGYVPPKKELQTVSVGAVKLSDSELFDVGDEVEDGESLRKDQIAKGEPKTIVCQRCYRLNHYGSIESNLRVQPALSQPELESDSSAVGTGDRLEKKRRKALTASSFRKRLETLKSKTAVIVYLVDIFDFHGTFLSSLHDIIGRRNPIFLAVNKIDLLPKDFKADRVERWIRSECGSFGLHDIASVHMISSTKGYGVSGLLADAVYLAKKRRCDVYVVGAANVGKSSFINRVVSLRRSRSQKNMSGRGSLGKRKGKAGEGNLTTSVIPGTTLGTIRISLGGDINLYDTPGIIVNHQLTNRLSAKELKAVLPSKNIECVTHRLGEGKSIFLGGLARIDVVEGRPFFFTAFVSDSVKVHPGKMENADDFLQKHCGGMLTPPFERERLEELGEWSSKTFTATGDGWKRASLDIVLSGLGWVSITGPGQARLRVSAPKGIGVFTREALMPFEVSAGVSKYTGSRSVNKKQMAKTAKLRKNSRKYSDIDDLGFV